jgi:hypothetical protein
VCGANCGNCVEGDVCNTQGVCEQEAVCEPECAGRECGPDPECGLSCGICQPEATCNADGKCIGIDPASGKLYGYVVKLESEEQEANLIHGRPAKDAKVWLTTGEIALTDEHGYYEMLVPAADHLVSASAEGCRAGSATCRVEAGGFTECFVPVYAEDSGEDPDLDDVVVRGGCATGGGAGRVWAWWIALGIVILFRPRSRQD